MAEKSRFDEIFRDRAAIQGQKWRGLSRAGFMERSGHHFFSGAGITGDEHRCLHGGGALDHGEDFLHRCATSDDVAIVPAIAQLAAQTGKFLAETFVFKRFADVVQKFFGVEWFGEIRRRTGFDRINGLRNRSKTGHQNHFRARMVLRQPAQQRTAVDARHREIGNDEVSGGWKGIDRLLTVDGGVYGVTVIAQRGGDGFTHGDIIFNEQYVERGVGHGCVLISAAFPCLMVHDRLWFLEFHQGGYHAGPLTRIEVNT